MEISSSRDELIIHADNIPYEKVGNAEPVPVEVPFEIPESWEWVRLSYFTISIGNKYNQINTKDIIADGRIPVVSQSQKIIDGYCNQDEKIICELPLIMFGDHTRMVKYIDFPFVIGADGTKFHKSIVVEPKYLFYWMRYTADKLRNRGYARHYSLLKEEFVPLPPLTEQHRIVAKIEELLPHIEKYEQAETQLNKLNSEFPAQLKKSILQLAVQGKLVPQDENDEPASVLLERIREEKKALIKAGKLKKDKNESFIFVRDNVHYENVGGVERCIEDEIPFDVPESWVWVRLGEISSYANTKRKINASEADKSIWCLDLENIEKGGRLICKKTVGERSAIGEKTLFNKGDILYSKLRPYLLKILIADDDGICTPEIVPFSLYGGNLI